MPPYIHTLLAIDRIAQDQPRIESERTEIREQRALQRREQSTFVWPYDLHRIRERLGEKYSETMMKQRFEEMKMLPSGIMDTPLFITVWVGERTFL